MMQQVNDVPMRAAYYKLIYDAIMSYLDEGVYKPLFVIMDQKMKAFNSKDDIIAEAIKSGVIYYDDSLQVFKTIKKKFDNKLSTALIDLGGRYLKRYNGYKIPIEKLSASLLMVMAQSSIHFREQMQLVDRFLNEVQGNIEYIVDSMIFDKEVMQIVDDVSGAVNKSVKRLNVIECDLNETQKRVVIDRYVNDIKKSIKGWLPERIASMRTKVAQLVEQGYREDAVVKLLQHEYNVRAKDKASFLARNETNLVMAELKRQMYTEMGFTKFIWKTRMDGLERPEHKEMNGKVYLYDDPPVIDVRTGQKGLPGQTYNCRCLAIPVI